MRWQTSFFKLVLEAGVGPLLRASVARRFLRRMLYASAMAITLVSAGLAAGPRWVTSRPPFNNDGQPIAWNRTDLTYWVDNGPLSNSVSNSAAQAMVSAAAAVWNIPYSRLTLTLGGMLNEDVSSSNVYVSSTGPIWPSDVASGNYRNEPIAVIFDTDGTLTDMLLGSGASSPSNCRQSAVTESVDLFVQPGSIAHAVVLLNGRCTGPAPEQQLQMQYQLMRAFGRVLGLGWSQLNDNVFTGAPAPTYQQQMHWPIMHPMDIVCGRYTYQCMPEPFTLRDDDKSSVRLLYGQSIYLPSDGKFLSGVLSFPTGRGMNGVNMVAVRQSTFGSYGVEPWEMTSAVTGFLFRGANGNPVTGSLSGFPSLQGTSSQQWSGYWAMANVPVIENVNWDNVYVTMQAINPLYTGQYAVGPFTTGPVTPSGSPATTTFTVVGRGSGDQRNTTVTNAATDCTTGNDGTETAPAAVAPGGMWSGRLCGYGHSSWGSVAVQAGRTATLEATALDESGGATVGKAHLLLGAWHGSDGIGTLPSVGAQNSPFNGRQNGTTQMKVAFANTETVRFAVTEERGEGRPDFTYAARLLYADSILPARMNAGGGAVRILGTGFQPGNSVAIGGVLATVTSLSPTEIDAVAPTLAALGGSVGNDVTVTDLRTGGTSTIIGGLVYGGASTDALVPVQSPPGNMVVGVPSVFSVRLVNSSGSVVANGSVVFSVTAGSAMFSNCNLNTCTLVTDANGLASSSVSALSAGAVVIKASISNGSAVQAQFTAVATAVTTAALRSPEYVAAGPGGLFHPAVVLVSAGARATNVPVAWTVQSGSISLGAASSSSAGDGITRVDAIANLTDGATAGLRACAWTSICVGLPIVGVAQEKLLITAVSGDGKVVGAGTRLATLVLRVTDPNGHGVAGATVQVHQAVSGWQPACPSSGRCPVAPTFATTSTAVVSDDDGLVAISPLQYDGTATVTKVVAATGTQGYLAVSLTKQP